MISTNIRLLGSEPRVIHGCREVVLFFRAFVTILFFIKYNKDIYRRGNHANSRIFQN